MEATIFRNAGPYRNSTCGSALVKRVFSLFKAVSRSGRGPVSTRQLATHLRADAGLVRRACEHLEAHGVISREWAYSDPLSPAYTITQEGHWAARAGAYSIIESGADAIVDVVCRSWGRYFGLALRPAANGHRPGSVRGRAVRFNSRITGQSEGAVSFDMGQGFLFRSLALAAGHGFRGIDDNVSGYAASLVGRVARDIELELVASGFDLRLSPARVHGRGPEPEQGASPAHVATLENRSGELTMRFALSDGARRPGDIEALIGEAASAA